MSSHRLRVEVDQAVGRRYRRDRDGGAVGSRRRQRLAGMAGRVGRQAVPVGVGDHRADEGAAGIDRAEIEGRVADVRVAGRGSEVGHGPGRARAGWHALGGRRDQSGNGSRGDRGRSAWQVEGVAAGAGAEGRLAAACVYRGAGDRGGKVVAKNAGDTAPGRVRHRQGGRWAARGNRGRGRREGRVEARDRRGDNRRGCGRNRE